MYSSPFDGGKKKKNPSFFIFSDRSVWHSDLTMSGTLLYRPEMYIAKLITSAIFHTLPPRGLINADRKVFAMKKVAKI